MTIPTLYNMLDIAKFKGADSIVGIIDETMKTFPEVSGFDLKNSRSIASGIASARTIKGRSYKTLVRTGLPTVAFRNANEGSSQSRSTFEERNVETFLMNPRWSMDRAIAESYEDGPAALMGLEASGQIQAGFRHVASQFYYGTSNDSKGFQGLQSFVDSAMVLDATGASANTGSSVYAVKFGPQHIQWVIGNDGSFNVPEEMRSETVYDENNKPYTAYVQEMMSCIGLQKVNKYSVARLKNLTAESGKSLDDDMLADLLNKFPVGIVPDVLFMTRRSISQLRKSRTATNAIGAPAPTPLEYEGIPIVPTDSLLDTEAIA
jgi:hypothetical protein